MTVTTKTTTREYGQIITNKLENVVEYFGRFSMVKLKKNVKRTE